MKKKWVLFFVFLTLSFSSISIVSATSSKNRTNVYKSLRLFEDVLRLIRTYYVKPTDMDSTIQNAVRGMLESLDPHSEYMTQSEYKEFMTGTEGEFGGLGIQISLVDKILTVVAPLEGTPAYRAGVQAGDRIIKIDSVSTDGITLKKAAQTLRGKPGTQVTITIMREGLAKPFDISITRARITIHPVPYFGMVKNRIGYLRLSSFSEKAATDVKSGLDSLFKMGAKKIIFDLRGNPGGLLPQAIRVADLFLPKNRVIVSTKGKMESQSYSSKSPPYYGLYPLIVLVDGGSASASEIVSGAIQDWDRGLILGKKTFGKGSVQRLFSTPSTGGAVKLTIALYYIPSGRCIDKLMARADTGKTYYSLGGLHRVLHGGGGITPDSTVSMPYYSRLEQNIIVRRLYFKYAVHFSSTHPDLKRPIIITDKMLSDFKKMVDETKIKYTECDWENSKNGIKQSIVLAIAQDKWGDKERYREFLKTDPQVKKAIKILESAKEVKDVF